MEFSRAVLAKEANACCNDKREEDNGGGLNEPQRHNRIYPSLFWLRPGSGFHSVHPASDSDIDPCKDVSVGGITMPSTFSIADTVIMGMLPKHANTCLICGALLSSDSAFQEYHMLKVHKLLI